SQQHPHSSVLADLVLADRPVPAFGDADTVLLVLVDAVRLQHRVALTLNPDTSACVGEDVVSSDLAFAGLHDRDPGVAVPANRVSGDDGRGLRGDRDAVGRVRSDVVLLDRPEPALGDEDARTVPAVDGVPPDGGVAAGRDGHASA